MSHRRFALFLISLACAAATAAEAQTCAPPALADKVELKPVAGTNLMTVPVAINGVGKQFLLDVGGNPDEISEAAVGELNLTPIDRQTASNRIAEINPYMQFEPPMVDVRSATFRPSQAQVRAGSFTIGGNTIANMQFLVSNDRDLGKSKPYDGRLTAAGFRKYDLDLDFGGKQLSFMAATACADPGQIARWPHTALAVIPMTLANGKMTIPVSIGGHQIDAVIDTGSDRSVMRRAIAERIFGLKADTDMTPVEDMRDGAGERVYQHTFPQITFEGVTASNVPALIQANSMVRAVRSAPTTGSRLSAPQSLAPPIPDLTLGMDVLHQLHIYAAFGQGKLYVTPAG